MGYCQLKAQLDCHKEQAVGKLITDGGPRAAWHCSNNGQDQHENGRGTQITLVDPIPSVVPPNNIVMQAR